MRATSTILLILLTWVPTVTGQCPVGCFCLAGYVTCSDLKYMPAVFPTDTRSLSITNINADEIPAGIFEKLPQIESIEIYQGRIGRISTGAFRSLTDMELISLNELTIGTIEPYAFSGIVNIGTISLYMSKIDTIKPFAFWDLFALDEIKLFMLEVAEMDSFAFNSIDELYHFSFYTNNIESMQPFALSNFTNIHKLSMNLNTFGQLGCGSIEGLVSETYDHSFHSNSVNCSCDLTWIQADENLKKFRFSNWCQVPDSDETIYWEDISAETLQCEVQEKDTCPTADIYESMIPYQSEEGIFIDPTKTVSNIPAEPASSSTKQAEPIVSFQTTTEKEAKPSHTSKSQLTTTSSFVIPEQPSSNPASSSPVHRSEAEVASFGKTSESVEFPSVELATKHFEMPVKPRTLSIAPLSSTSRTSVGSGILLTSTEDLPERTRSTSNPKVVLSNGKEVIKAVDANKGAKDKVQPQNVSFREDNVNGSARVHTYLSVMLLTLIAAMMI